MPSGLCTPLPAAFARADGVSIVTIAVEYGAAVDLLREIASAPDMAYIAPTTRDIAGIYERIEWAAAEVFGGELGMAYLGTQGDVWDGHRDMGLASLGAFLAMTVAYLFAVRRSRAAAGR